jgi:hypothetical protein
MKADTAERNDWRVLDKPVYGPKDLEGMFGSRAKIWRIQKQGFLKKLPGQHALLVSRSEVIRYLESA